MKTIRILLVVSTLLVSAASVLSAQSIQIEPIVSCFNAEVNVEKQRARVTCGVPSGNYKRVYLELGTNRTQRSERDVQHEFEFHKKDELVVAELWAVVTTAGDDSKTKTSRALLCWDGEKVFLKNGITMLLLTEGGVEPLPDDDRDALACFESEASIEKLAERYW